jgi:hypothetical protein
LITMMTTFFIAQPILSFISDKYFLQSKSVLNRSPNTAGSFL